MQVDFYILEKKANFLDSLPFTCSLAEKAYHSGHALFVQTENASLQSALNEALWTYRDESFLPHHCADTPSPYSVHITHVRESVASVALSLSTHPLPDTGDWKRRLYIVPNDPKALESARNRFRHYQSLGYSVNSHKIKS